MRQRRARKKSPRVFFVPLEGAALYYLPKPGTIVSFVEADEACTEATAAQRDDTTDDDDQDEPR